MSIGLGLPSACLVRQRLVAHHMRIRQQPRLELKGILQQLVQGAVKDAFPGVKLVNQQHENDESIFQVNSRHDEVVRRCARSCVLCSSFGCNIDAC